MAGVCGGERRKGEVGSVKGEGAEEEGRRRGGVGGAVRGAGEDGERVSRALSN